MTDAPQQRAPDQGDGPDELPEHLFRRGDDWKWIEAARRERRRQQMKERLAALASRDNRVMVLAIAAPVLVLAAAWLLGAVR